MVDVKFSWNSRVIILSVFAIVLSIIIVFVTEIKCVNKILLHINNKSIHDDIWQDVIDYKNGTTLRFICGNNIYIGVLVGHEEKGNDSWFILEDFTVEENDGNYKAEDMQVFSRMAINIRNVDRVELYYGEPKESCIDKIKDLFITKIFKKQTNKEQES